MSNLEWAQKLSKRLINKYGAEITVRMTLPAPEPDNPWDPVEPVKFEKEVRGLFSRFQKEHIDGTLIKQEDRQVYVAGLDLPESQIAIRLNGQVQMGSQIWQVISIDLVAPDENTILYLFHVRR